MVAGSDHLQSRKKGEAMKTMFLVIMGLAALLLSLTVAAQVQNENLANGILAARKKEAALLQQYNWNCRTEILRDSKVQDLRIDLVTCGSDGQPQRTLLNDQPGKLPNGFLRKAVAANKRKEIEKYVSDLSKLVDQYTLPSAGKVIDFLAQAQVQPLTTPDGKTLLQVSGNNVVVAGDTFTMMVDGRTLQPTAIQITTLYNGAQATVSATFKAMKTGPNHLQYATVEVPDKKVTVMIHNYDYAPND
jgi:hypothetical protein